MMPLSKISFAVLPLALAAPLFSTTGWADADAVLQPIELISSQVTADPLARTITLALTFDRAPDLQSYNAQINAADEFAIDILNVPLDHASLTGSGGEDLRILSSQYRVADSLINSGRTATPLGYSAITTPRFAGSLLLDLVPFTEVGSTVTITASYSQLHEADGLFEATLETYRHGVWSGSISEVGTVFSGAPGTGVLSTAAPEPASLAVLGFGGLALLMRRKKAAAC